MEENATVGVGPIAQALDARRFDASFLLTDHGDEAATYIRWLEARSGATEINLLPEQLTGPTEFGEIYGAAVRACEQALATKRGAALTFHLSPGTPAMAAVWIILAKTRFPAAMIESSREHGVRTASVPFDISADFLPDLLRQPDRELERLSAGLPPEAPEFDAIVHRSPVMQRVILRARRVAPRSVPVLLEGETGTGKELMARAIHQASPRRGRPFIAVNCGALPPELVESELFGHEKGAFTGADRARPGYFAAANGGTLFLDEIGELPAAAQVKLLRVLQEGAVVRVGATTPRRVDVRVIAATNRTLTEEVAAGRFREDLFYRLAVAVLQLPPLRDRAETLGCSPIDSLSGSTPRVRASRATERRDFLLQQETLRCATPGPATYASCPTRCAASRSGRTRRPSRRRTCAMPCSRPSATPTGGSWTARWGTASAFPNSWQRSRGTTWAAPWRMRPTTRPEPPNWWGWRATRPSPTGCPNTDLASDGMVIAVACCQRRQA